MIKYYFYGLTFLLFGCATSDVSNIQQLTEVSAENNSEVKKEELEVRKFPRELKLPDSTLVVYQPQLESWNKHDELVGWSAVLIKPNNGADPITGAIKFSAKTDVDYEARTAVAYNKKILDVNFPTLKQHQVDKLKSNILKALSKVPEIIPLDILLSAMSNKNIVAKPVMVSIKPPKIFYSAAPMLLLLFDGDPLFAKIENTALKFSINTNWDMFHDEGSANYFLRNDKEWLVASDYNGPWLVTTKLPADLSKLPKGNNWDAVSQAIPAKKITNDMSRVVKVSVEPAELIVTQGKPILEAIGNGQLHFVKNTKSDLFFHKGSGQYYFLVSGRWFKTTTLNGAWLYAKDLPEDFSKIPADHTKASVRASVPGTVEAKLAILQAQVPRKATVDRSQGAVTVSYRGEPVFETISGTTLKYAINTSFDVIQSGKYYYLCYQGIWFLSERANGPWVVADSIPIEIYNIPPDSPIYNVTYVRVYDSTPASVTVGYTSGYHNMYVSYGVVMYGTGYYYNPYWYHDPLYPYYPIYYPRYPSYGMAAYYNPYTGTYGRGGYYYGPYGGYGRGASYNPVSGRYSRGATAWGPSGSVYARQAYNPSTGVFSESIQSMNSYAHWGESVARHGNDWIKTSHYTDSKGARKKFETSSGAKGAQFKGQEHSLGAIKNKDGELFVGKDRNVYKRNDDGWMKKDSEGWAPVDKSFDRESAKKNLNESGINSDSVSKSKEKLSAQGISRDLSSKSEAGVVYQDWSSNSNIEKLNRDFQSRSYGNQRFNDAQASQQRSSTFNRGSQPARTMPSRPAGGGGRFRR